MAVKKLIDRGGEQWERWGMSRLRWLENLRERLDIPKLVRMWQPEASVTVLVITTAFGALLRITAGGSEGFLVLFRTEDNWDTDPSVYEAWSVDTSSETLAFSKKFDYPGDEPTGPAGWHIARYWRGLDGAAALADKDIDGVPSYRELGPADEAWGEKLELLAASTGLMTPTPPWSDGRVFARYGASGRMHSLVTREYVDFTQSSTLGETEVGTSGTLSRGTRVLTNDRAQYSIWHRDDDQSKLYYQDYDVTDTSVATSGSPTTVTAPNYRVTQPSAGHSFTHSHSTIALGGASKVELTYSGSGATSDWSPGFLDTYDVEAPMRGAMGAPGFINDCLMSAAADRFVTLYGLSATPHTVTATISGQQFVLHDEQMANGRGTIAHVYAYHAWVDGYDYWHIYVASNFVTTDDVVYGNYLPWVTRIRTHVIKANAAGATQVFSDEVQWEYTFGVDPTVDGQHYFYLPVGGGKSEDDEVWIAGFEIEQNSLYRGSPYMAKIRPAQWKPDMSAKHVYSDWTDSPSNWPHSHQLYAPLEWVDLKYDSETGARLDSPGELGSKVYVSTDENGAFFVFEYGGTVRAQRLGSPDDPVTVSGPVGADHIGAPAADALIGPYVFPYTTGRTTTS